MIVLLGALKTDEDISCGNDLVDMEKELKPEILLNKRQLNLQQECRYGKHLRRNPSYFLRLTRDMKGQLPSKWLVPFSVLCI